MSQQDRSQMNCGIGEISRRSGVKIETIRYYERIKVLRAPMRSASRIRIYNADDLRTLTFIRRSRELGFSLSDIRALLDLGAPGGALCGDVKAVAVRNLKSVRER